MVCLIFTPEARGPGAEVGHIRQAMRTYMLQLLCYTLLARDYIALWYGLQVSIVTFR